MQGLEIARRFFFEWGKAHLESAFPEVAQRAAVGRIFGSDVIGADDAISQDHNWGPQFTIFLSAEDYERYGAEIADVLNAAAPTPWQGFKLNGAGDKSVLVESIPQWVETNLGFSQHPTTDEAWTHIVKDRIDGGTGEARESILYFLRHGAIWFDGSGELTGWRQALHTYPQRIWYARLAEEIFRVWQHGEYNFVQRVAKRQDPLATAICLGEFTKSVMRLWLLRNHDFTPYWKWLAHEFRKAEGAETYIPLLETLVSDQRTEIQIERVLTISGLLHQQLHADGILSGQGDSPYLLPLLNAHIELQNKANVL